MTAAQLKASILQLAVSGKLVPQDPKDEPASVLLERIQAEKAKLVKDGKIKKEKPLPPIEDEDIPFEIPSGWVWCRMGELCNYGTCKSVEGSAVPKNAWVLDLEEVEKGTGKLLARRTAKDKDAKSNKHVFAKGMVLYSKLRTYLNKVLVAPEDGFCTTEIIPVQYWGGIIPEFARFFLMSPYMLDYAASLGYGIKMPRIGTDDARNVLFPLPPLAEQHRIVAKVDELLPLVDRYAALEDKRLKLEADLPGALRKSILQQAIEGKLTDRDPKDEPASELLKRIADEKAKLVKEGKLKKEKPLPPIADEEKPFDLPEGWEWCRWGNIAHSIQYGYNAPAKETGRIRMVRISDVQDGRVIWGKVPFCDITEESIQDYLLKPRDILFARTGGTVGKSYLVNEVPYESIYAGYLIRTRYGIELEPRYLKYFMESDLYWAQLRSGTTATAQPNCNGQTLSRMMLPLPPLAEQKRIVAKVESLLADIDRLRK